MTLFSLSALFSLAAILGATLLAIRGIYTENVLRGAQQQSVSVAQALFIQELDLLTAGRPDDVSTLEVSTQTFGLVDRRMHDYLQPFGIVKIKVFDMGARIIYSTDAAIIGTVDNGNARLLRTLGGRTESVMVTKDRFVDLEHEERFDIDVVETYVPVTNRGGRIIGAMEIYLDVTRYREQLTTVLRSSAVTIGSILLVAFGVVFLIMRKGTRQLSLYEGQLHDMAVTDVLTGIANRRFLLDRATEEFARIQRTRCPEGTGCILVDIDHFKCVNDDYGHDAGDEVLREVAACLKHAVRGYDLVGRYGGEEFLVIAPNSDFEETREVAERIWRAVRDRPFRVGDRALRVTISVGLACVEPGDPSIDAVIQRADQGLYLAKSGGRDQVAWIDHPADSRPVAAQ